MSDLMVGIDVGTSRLKAGVFDTTGTPVAFAQRECPVSTRDQNTAELDANVWWQALQEAISDCLKRADAGAVRAIGLSSQAQSYVWTDDKGQAAGPAISWLDRRGDGPGVATALSAYDFYRHTGWADADPMLAVCKLRQGTGRPDVCDARGHLLFTDGFLIHRLCGETVISRNLAAMTGLYSLKESDWWEPALKCAHVDRELLPAIRDVGEQAGSLRPEIARHWGTECIPVVTGANDQTAAAIGAGLCRPGDVNLGLGTALVAYQVIRPDSPPPVARPLRGEYVNGLNFQLTLHNTAGGVVEWARNTFCCEASWDRFFDVALSAAPGADGLICRPDFSADSGGSVRGLALGHERPQLLRAILEGVALTAREKLDQLDAPEEITVTGAASANDRWMQLMADVTGRAIKALNRSQTTLWGTALAAGAGAELFPDILEVSRERRSTRSRFMPAPAGKKIYDTLYTNFRQTGAQGAK